VVSYFGTAEANVPPTVSIISPDDGSPFDSGTSISFSGSASDAEDGDLTASLVWNSDLDGQIGTGGSFSVVLLSDGTHTIIAEVTDSGGDNSSDSITITVSGSSGGDFALTAAGYKVRGRQKADLEWSGATSTEVDVYRDGALLTTTANDGFYTDDIDQVGGGSYKYQLCEEGTTTCSNEATVTF
jgi:hypothetical protein